MVSPEKLERVLRDFNFTYETRVAGILTKTGVPMAIQANVELEEEHFATMAATLVGSTEVLYRGMGMTRPDRILVRSKDGVMFVLNLEDNAFFVAVGGEGCCLAERSEEAAEALRRVLKPLRPLKRFAT
jgi:predicted regulator of Ras-like GTPase activity (Roadblock/LC7/MglB family)